MAAENVESCLRDQVAIRLEVDTILSEAFIGDSAVIRLTRRLLVAESDLQFEPDGKGKTDNIKSRAFQESVRDLSFALDQSIPMLAEEHGTPAKR
jgi:hypothetical protein